MQSISHRRYIFCGAGVGLLRLGVTQHLALWSPDFPLTLIVHERSSGPLPPPSNMVGPKERECKRGMLKKSTSHVPRQRRASFTKVATNAERGFAQAGRLHVVLMY